MSLVLFTSDGDILVANGRGGYSSIRKRTAAEILAEWDIDRSHSLAAR